MKKMLLLVLAFVSLTGFYSEEVKAPSVENAAKEVDIPLQAPRMSDYSHSGKITREVGQNVVLSVKYTAYPLPICEVYKDGKLIVNSLVYRIRNIASINSGEVSVEIESAELEDAGNYKIVLTNPLGAVSVTYVVEIIKNPDL